MVKRNCGDMLRVNPSTRRQQWMGRVARPTNAGRLWMRWTADRPCCTKRAEEEAPPNGLGILLARPASTQGTDHKSTYHNRRIHAEASSVERWSRGREGRRPTDPAISAAAIPC